MICRIGRLILLGGILAPLPWAQNPPAPAPARTPAPASEVQDQLREVRDLIRGQAQMLAEQREQIQRQQAEIEELRGKMGLRHTDETVANQAAADLSRQVEAIRTRQVEAIRRPTQATAHIELASLEPSLGRSVAPTVNPPPVIAVAVPQQQGGEKPDRPLSIHFGKASLTPGGWVDFTAIYRTRDVGSGLGTTFATIPYDNTVQGGLSETRFTSQNSRITLRADENFSRTRVFGYVEADFNGVLPGNAYVSTNSNSLRLRVFYTDLSRGRWEFLGGQSWSMLTPNRVAISPFLTEIYNTLHLDSNYQVGLTYAQARPSSAILSITPTVDLGLSAENPTQYSGAAATFPRSSAPPDRSDSPGPEALAAAPPPPPCIRT